MTSSAGIVPLPPPARRDVGLGSAYERWAVYELLGKWLAEDPPKTALEGPADGMAGIPGLHLIPAAARGARVTVIVPDEEGVEVVRGVYRTAGLENRLDARAGASWPDETFDLVLTYNALPAVPDWKRYLAEAGAHARRQLVVSVTHPGSYGVYLRRALRLAQPGEITPEPFDHPSSSPSALEAELQRFGRITGDAYVDCPWWPCLSVETGETLLSGTLSRLPFGARFRRGPAAAAPADPRQEPFLYGPGRFPFFGGNGWADELQPALRRHPNLEGSRFRALASFLAHQRMLRVTKAEPKTTAS
ncbi:MAG: class I SAM-dependent methyltransferase [Thermoanaerobaculia bacterium]